MHFYLFLWMLELATTDAKNIQYFTKEPKNQTAIEGQQVILACRVENKIGVLQWTKDGFGLGDTTDLSEYSRYKIVENNDEKDWFLQISPVLLEDDAIFQCQVGAADEVAPIRSENAQLTVYVPSDDPYIVQGNMIEVIEDEETWLECVSTGGKPAVDIYWQDGDGHVIKEGVKTMKTILKDQKRFNITSKITFIPMKWHHNNVFQCSTNNIADRFRRSVSISLKVRLSQSQKNNFTNTKVMGRNELSLHLKNQEQFLMIIIPTVIFTTIITLVLLFCGYKLCEFYRHREEKPKEININSTVPSILVNKSAVQATDDDCCENKKIDKDDFDHCLHNYLDQEYPLKSDFNIPGYVPFGRYVHDFNPLFPTSDSQTFLQSGNQIAPNIYNSTINNLSGLPKSLTSIKPYLKYQSKHNQYSTSFQLESSSTNIFQPFSNDNKQQPLHLIHSPASTNSVNSDMSSFRSIIDSPPSPMPIYVANSFELSNISENSCVLGTNSLYLQHKHPISNDLYQIMSQPRVVNHRKDINPITSDSGTLINKKLDQNITTSLAKSSSDKRFSPLKYVLDSNSCNKDKGTHV